MCGITAFYPKSKKKADFNIIKGIAAINDERGKDNSGIAIGDIFFQKSAVDKYIRDLITRHKDEISGLDTVGAPWILHTRASSNKTKMMEKHAHPYEWDYINAAGEKTDYFKGCHNGYVSNTTDLHKKYILDKGKRTNKATDYDVDSECILDCITSNLSDQETVKSILTDYTGNAALVFYTKDYFYVWKGACNNIEERPLYMVETKDGWYFSSIEASLGMYFDNVTLVPHNSLTTFYKNKFLSQDIINRRVEHVSHAQSVNRTHPNHVVPDKETNVYFNAKTLSWQRVLRTDTYVMEGNYFMKDAILQNGVFETKTASHYIPIAFTNGVAVKKVTQQLEVAIHQLTNCTDLALAQSVITRHKEVLFKNMIGFIPVRQDDTIIGVVVKEGDDVVLLGENQQLTTRFLSKKIEIINQLNKISVHSEPFKQLANV